MKNENKTIVIPIFTTLLGGIALLSYQACSEAPKSGSDSPEIQPGREESRAPEPTSAAKAEEAKEEMVFRGPGEMLPKNVDGFSVSSAPRYFGPDNLFDLINGGAEIYVEFGLKEMVTADFKSGERKDITITVEVYDQGSPLGAFGRMARFLSEKVDPSKAGQGLPDGLENRGLFGATDLIFFKDRYLVHVTLIDESPDATMESMSKAGKEILPMFAKALASKIEADPPLPKELGLFPAEQRIARSEAWVTSNLGGVRELGPGFSSRYSDGKASWTLFITDEDKDGAPAEKKTEQLKAGITDERPFGFEEAGKRLVGFVADQDGWTDKNRKAAAEQIASLKAALESSM